jgi:hypothetical protein
MVYPFVDEVILHCPAGVENFVTDRSGPDEKLSRQPFRLILNRCESAQTVSTGAESENLSIAPRLLYNPVA